MRQDKLCEPSRNLKRYRIQKSLIKIFLSHTVSLNDRIKAGVVVSYSVESYQESDGSPLLICVNFVEN